MFVECIPYDETREYVKRVMANTVHYALLLEGRSISLKQRLGIIAGREPGDEGADDGEDAQDGGS